VASNLGLDTAALAAKSGVVDYIRRCQVTEQQYIQYMKHRQLQGQYSHLE
jgi:hypothetical protein